MSISSSLTNALSGLTAASRAAEVVSSNISNALTEGYGKRELTLSSNVLDGRGTGVRVDGVTRETDPILLGNRREAEASLGNASIAAGFLSNIEAAIGLPGDPGALTDRVTQFEAALIEAASRPDSPSRLQAVFQTASGLAGHLNQISDRLQAERLSADRAIARSVDQLNTALQQVEELNTRIAQFHGAKQDASSLIDQRQSVIDGIADLVPLREVQRQNGMVALFTPGGAILLDGRAAEIGFTPVSTITPDMTLGSGALSGLTVNEQPVSADPHSGPLSGGKLAGLFAVRDVEAPALQSQADAVARDLVERFADPAVDPTLASGDPGLFTDAGAALVPADELGLAGRISINALVDPAAGGAHWRLRDGLGAAGPGESGNATLLNAMSDALTGERVPASGDFSVARSAIGLSGDFLSGISVSAQDAAARQSFDQAQADTLISAELQMGVDTDDELQKLLVVERAFAANARVVSTVDEMLQTLLGL
ncbi:MAG: flagellar hook-associated protein FlgK [Rhodobacter sp.]|nr:flagellar hook-associated protein FlgK [Rhodobacter sp.]